MRGADVAWYPIPRPLVLKSPNPCWRFHQGQYCPEDLCHYQHGPRLVLDRHTSRRSPASYGPTACIYFARGFCKNGATCKFAHVNPLSHATQGSSSAGPLQASYNCSQTQGSEVSSKQVDSPCLVLDTPESSLFHSAILTRNAKNDPQSVAGQFEVSTLLPSGKPAAEVDVTSDSAGTVTPLTLPKDSPSPPSTSQDQGTTPFQSPVATSPSPCVIEEGVASIWDEIDGLDEEDFVSRHVPYIDTNHHAPQVYDDKTVCVLSGGVMLGIPGPSRSPRPDPPVVSGLPLQPVQERSLLPPPLSKSPSTMSVPSLVVSWEDFSAKNDDADSLSSSLDWDSGAQSPAVWGDEDVRDGSISLGCEVAEDKGPNISRTSSASLSVTKSPYKFPRQSSRAPSSGPNERPYSTNDGKLLSTRISPISPSQILQQPSRTQRVMSPRGSPEQPGGQAVEVEVPADKSMEAGHESGAKSLERIADARRRSSSFVEAGIDARAVRLLTKKEKEILVGQSSHRRVPSI